MSWYDYASEKFSSLLIDKENFAHTIETYCGLLNLARSQFNLIGSNESVPDHIIDSLSCLEFFVAHAQHTIAEKSNTTHVICADLGSGAGLPGMPLALAFDAAHIRSKWYLVERATKKFAFLQNVATHLAPMLRHTEIHVVSSNLKEWRPPLNIDILTYRAFRPFESIVSQLRKCAPHADLFLYKGKRIALNAELSPFINKNIEWVNVHTLTHFEEKERHLVHLRWKKI